MLADAAPWFLWAGSGLLTCSRQIEITWLLQTSRNEQQRCLAACMVFLSWLYSADLQQANRLCLANLNSRTRTMKLLRPKGTRGGSAVMICLQEAQYSAQKMQLDAAGPAVTNIRHRCLSNEHAFAFQPPTCLSQPNAKKRHLPVSGSSLQLSRCVMTSSSHVSANTERNLDRTCSGCLQMSPQTQHQTHRILREHC